jgi:hypothetical protein
LYQIRVYRDLYTALKQRLSNPELRQEGKTKQNPYDAAHQVLEELQKAGKRIKKKKEA